MSFKAFKAMPWRSCPAVAMVMLACAIAQAERAESKPDAAEKTDKTEFLRFQENDNGGGKLETAIATYTNPAGVKVHLVAAVHLGEPEYYAGLNKTFAGYDALLYEMVKPKDSGAPEPGQHSDNMINMFQRFLTETLELQFQLDGIDYQKPNFVHADLDAETFTKMQEERGESMLTLMLQEMLRQLTNPEKAAKGAAAPELGLADLLDALTSPDRANKLKMMLGRQFGDIEEQMAGMQGGTVIITERNKACFKVLRDTIADGKKDIGIFYGAGHMSDMESRLKDMGFHRTDVEYRVAWDMTKKSSKARDNPDRPRKKAPRKNDEDSDEAQEAKGIIKVEYSR